MGPDSKTFIDQSDDQASPGPKDTLRIDGKPYLLCKRKSELPKNR